MIYIIDFELFLVNPQSCKRLMPYKVLSALDIAGTILHHNLIYYLYMYNTV